MGFFDLEENPSHGDLRIKGLSVDTMHRRGCDVCPLNMSECKSPNMRPSGAKRPVVYILGSHPTRRDDAKDAHFTGAVGDVLRMRIPPKWDKDLRWNYTVRTMPPQRLPSQVETECCRMSIIKDIERCKPAAIFGFGKNVLHWAIRERAINDWAGRRIPIKLGEGTYWFYPMLDPEEVLDSRRFEPRDADQWGSSMEFKFAFDMKMALREIAKLPEPVVHTRDDALANIEWVTGRNNGDMGKALDFIASCYDEKVVGLDYETQGLRPYAKRGKILTASLATKDRVFSFPFHHRSSGWNAHQLVELQRVWREFLIESKTRKVSHNLFFEQEWSAFTFGRETIENDTWDDSLSQAYLLDERTWTQSLDFLCQQHWGLPVKDLFKLNKDDMDSEKLETILLYNGVDAKYHRKLYFNQMRRLEKEDLLSVYKHQLQRVNAAVMTSIKGVPISRNVVEANYKKYRDEIDAVAEDIQALPLARQFKRRVGHAIRPSNNFDVADALKMAGIKLEPTKNKKRKKVPEGASVNLSTTEEALNKVKHPLAKLIIKWRKASKLLGIYVLPVRRKDTVTSDGKLHKTQLHPDGLLHPIVNSAKTRSWRTASEDPNIQNWPKRGPSKIIREEVAVADDEVIVAIDYAGIQARNVAMESRDKVLVQSYWDHYDIHGDWLEKLLKRVPDWMPPKDIGQGLSAKELFKERRSVVKNGFVFPSFFGAAGKSIAGDKYLKIEERHAISLSEEFFDTFKAVKKWQERIKAAYFETGYVTGCSGFKRRAPIDVNQLINAPIQADETIIVCGAWARLCRTGDPRLVPNWMVHDDLSFVWKKKQLDKLLEQTIPIMLHQVHDWEKIVPMAIEVSTGQDWCNLKAIGEFETTKSGGWREIKKG